VCDRAKRVGKHRLSDAYRFLRERIVHQIGSASECKDDSEADECRRCDEQTNELGTLVVFGGFVVLAVVLLGHESSLCEQGTHIATCKGCVVEVTVKAQKASTVTTCLGLGDVLGDVALVDVVDGLERESDHDVLQKYYWDSSSRTYSAMTVEGARRSALATRRGAVPMR
jgi:hypothetical protein